MDTHRSAGSNSLSSKKWGISMQQSSNETRTFKSRVLATVTSVALAAGAALAIASSAQAGGTIILEGSDAIGFHAGFGDASAQAYTDQTFSALGGSSALTVAVIGSTASGNAVVSNTHAISLFADFSTAGSLSNFAAIYILGDNGCCNSGTNYLAGRQTDITNYLNLGRTVEIGDYDGSATWDFLTGGSGNSAFVAGVGGALGGPSCTDGESVTAAGLANGFTQPGVLSCWTHQAYSQPYFAGLGFTQSFFDADPAFASANPGYGSFSSLLSNGSTQTGIDNGVPEPATWALMIVGFGFAGGMMRRSRRELAKAV